MKEIKEVWVTAQFINKNGSIDVFPNYQVSNLGRVMSLNYRRTKKPKILKLGSRKFSNGTYSFVNLCRDKKSYCRDVHRMVMSSFEPKGYFKKAVVDHIDSNPSNNQLSNLRWVTQQKNSGTKHCRESRSRSLTNRPDQSKKVKVTFLDDRHYEIFPSAREASRVLGLPFNAVSVCITDQRNGFYRKLNVLFEYI